MATLQLLTDQALGEASSPVDDGLGFDTYAQILSHAAINTLGPLTIGIFGEWGTGKTSLMKMISSSLDKRSDVIVVWFNAWRYEKEEHPIVPLVASIMKDVQGKKSFLDRLSDSGKELVRSLRAVAYGFSAKSKVKVPGFAEIEASFVAKDMIEREEKLRTDPLLDRSLYYGAFETLASVKLEGKIVVLIDDLDRCFPDLAIKLLESIKLALCQPGFVFIMGVARTVIEGYLNYRYKEDYGLKDFDGASYLDKIVQLPFYIPPHRGRIDLLLDKLLSAIDPSIQGEFTKVKPIIAAASGSNPRATKRFINNLLIDQAINKTLASIEVPEQNRMKKIPISYFAVTRALQQKWNSIFLLLTLYSELCDNVANFTQDNLARYATSQESEISTIATTLLGDRVLSDILFSEQGKAWLIDHHIRNATIEFLKEKRIDQTDSRSRLSEDEFDIYISYQKEDQLYVSEIASFLSNLGIRFFIDQEQLIPGDDWRKKIESALLKSRIFAVCIGKHWPKIGWQHNEVDIILNLNIKYHNFRIIPILLPGADPDEIPDVLRTLHWLDMRDGISKDTLMLLERALSHWRRSR
ncbi:MAG: P-loop NTPase fold protein [Rhodospirillales bacterium]